MFQPAIETLPREQLRKLQNERLRVTLQRVIDRVPFYQKGFREAGIERADAFSLEDLIALPVTTKEDLRQHYPFGLFAEPMDQVARIHASSGTTGKPTVVGYTQQDLQIFGEVCARSLSAAGARPGMMLHNAYGYGLFTGGLGLHAGGEALGMSVIPVSGGMTDRQVMLLLDFGAQVISCTPSYALTLAEEFQKRGIGPKEHNLKYALLGAEPWTEGIRRQVEKGLGVQATNIYGLSEIIGPGVAQESVEEKGSGSYVWEDHFYPEILDRDSGQPVPDGAIGILTFTTLTKEALPLIRYSTGDLTWIKREHDGTRTHAKMGPILGRADDMLIIRGVNVFPSQIQELLSDIPELASHFIMEVSREQTLDHVLVKVENTPEAHLRFQTLSTESDTPSGRLQKLIRQRIGLSMAIEVEEPGTLPRSEGGKTGHVVDRRKMS